MNSVEQYMQQYFVEQSLANFMALRKAVSESADYNPYAVYESDVYALMSQGQLVEASAHLQSMMSGWILNPGIHKLASWVFYKLGKQMEADAEYTLASVFLDALLSTGQGSLAKPYLVLYVADEYDVLSDLEKVSQLQSFVEQDGRYYDCHKCQDGDDVWFDISVPHLYLKQQSDF